MNFEDIIPYLLEGVGIIISVMLAYMALQIRITKVEKDYEHLSRRQDRTDDKLDQILKCSMDIRERISKLER